MTNWKKIALIIAGVGLIAFIITTATIWKNKNNEEGKITATAPEEKNAVLIISKNVSSPQGKINITTNENNLANFNFIAQKEDIVIDTLIFTLKNNYDHWTKFELHNRQTGTRIIGTREENMAYFTGLNLSLKKGQLNIIEILAQNENQQKGKIQVGLISAGDRKIATPNNIDDLSSYPVLGNELNY